MQGVERLSQETRVPPGKLTEGLTVFALKGGNLI
jgi:hypothetical protein